MAALVSLQANPPALNPVALDAKEQALFALLRGLDRVIIAYSGGTDSAYLAWAAHRALGDETGGPTGRIGSPAGQDSGRALTSGLRTQR